MANLIKKCEILSYTLYFHRPAGTSRGILFKKPSYFLKATLENGQVYWGECGLLPGLSIDARSGYQEKLIETANKLVTKDIDFSDLREWPSIRFGVEMLLKQIQHKATGCVVKNGFYENEIGIAINGLIWMGDPSFMRQQIVSKVDAGFRCIKMKVGALDWQTEKDILQELRTAGGDSLTIRVDANGAWRWNDETKDKLDFLHKIGIHSIEQPIAVNQLQDLADLCVWSPINIALDEELFSHHTLEDKKKLLATVNPHFIVLKPSLVGGMASCDEWISAAKERNVDFWITSALESNIGLNAISQYTYDLAGDMYQGLGTGSLYENNIDSPLEIRKDELFYNRNRTWDMEKWNEK